MGDSIERHYKDIEESKFKRIMECRRKNGSSIKDAFNKDAVDKRILKTRALCAPDIDEYGIFIASSINRNMEVRIPDEAVAVNDTLIMDVNRLADIEGIPRSRIKVTGGRNLKYLVYSKEVQESIRLAATIRPVKANGVRIKPDSKAFLEMFILSVQKDSAVIPLVHSVIELSDSILDDALIMYICLNAPILRSVNKAAEFEYSGRKIEETFNRRMLEALKEYKSMVKKSGTLHTKDINRNRCISDAVNKLESIGYSVEIDSSVKINCRLLKALEYTDAPEILAEVVQKYGILELDGIVITHVAPWLEGMLGESGLFTYMKILDMMIKLVYLDINILGCITVSDNGRCKTKYIAAIDNRNRYRLARIGNGVNAVGLNSLLEWEFLDSILAVHNDGSMQLLDLKQDEDRTILDGIK